MSDCGTAVCCAKNDSAGLRISEFPVKFPDSRESRMETGAISTASPASHSSVRPDFPSARMGRKARLFGHSVLSPGSQLANRGPSIAESLQPQPRKFPFCRDDRRRLGAITTAARGWQSISHKHNGLSQCVGHGLRAFREGKRALASASVPDR
jgi:hypothetical protein